MQLWRLFFDEIKSYINKEIVKYRQKIEKKFSKNQSKPLKR